MDYSKAEFFADHEESQSSACRLVISQSQPCVSGRVVCSGNSASVSVHHSENTEDSFENDEIKVTISYCSTKTSS